MDGRLVRPLRVPLYASPSPSMAPPWPLPSPLMWIPLISPSEILRDTKGTGAELKVTLDVLQRLSSLERPLEMRLSKQCRVYLFTNLDIQTSNCLELLLHDGFSGVCCRCFDYHAV